MQGKYYAGLSKNRENVLLSSSGGLFFEIGSQVIRDKGVVYGAVQTDPLHVRHMRATSIEELALFRKSKYISSEIGNCYSYIRSDLDSGKLVLFSGVGCQIAGLYKYLVKEYENLITCEVVCHGAPISEVHAKYVKSREDELISIDYRNKTKGWKNNQIEELYKSGEKKLIQSDVHPVHGLYVRGINMKPGCEYCIYQSPNRIADITLADFWKYQGKLCEIGSEIGISLIVVNTLKGNEVINSISKFVYIEQVTKEEAYDSCERLSHPPKRHRSHNTFMFMINKYDFDVMAKLFLNFGEIRLAKECVTFDEISDNDVIEIYSKDPQETIYITDAKGVIKNIVTYGSFIYNYAKNKNYISSDFCKVVFSGNIYNELEKAFVSNHRIMSIPVVDNEGRFLFEVRRSARTEEFADNRRLLLPFSILTHYQINWLYVKRPDTIQNYPYSGNQLDRMYKGLNVSSMLDNIEIYEPYFKENLGCGCTKEYIEELKKIPEIYEVGDYYVHKDCISKYVNVFGGLRIVKNFPIKFDKRIHVYGRCGVFGYFVKDSDNIPSVLQSLLLQNDYNDIGVINHGLWGGSNEIILGNLLKDIQNQRISENDVVIVYMDDIPFMEELKKICDQYIDTTNFFHKLLEEGANFWDKPGHMNAVGYKGIANEIFSKLCSFGWLDECTTSTGEYEYNLKEIPNELRKYLDPIKEKIPNKEGQKIGTIVMNCNPFTKGHRYLIERALKDVDILIIFVVEEDKSYFKFEDRIKMVQLGVKDLENVYVFPSGKYIISSITFPEYFMKEHLQTVDICPTNDIFFFANYIAPYLGITSRFAGEEPTDRVTNQYNEVMKNMLPMYGIVFKEIPRLKHEDHIISASYVRKGLENGTAEIIKNDLLNIIYNYLVERGYVKKNE